VQSEGAQPPAGQGGFGRGRGGFAGPAAAPGTYVVKLLVNGKEVAQKTVVVDADSLQ